LVQRYPATARPLALDEDDAAAGQQHQPIEEAAATNHLNFLGAAARRLNSVDKLALYCAFPYFCY